MRLRHEEQEKQEHWGDNGVLYKIAIEGTFENVRLRHEEQEEQEHGGDDGVLTNFYWYVDVLEAQMLFHNSVVPKRTHSIVREHIL